MKTVRWLVLATVVPVLGGCATIQGRSDYDREVEFAAFQTFAWLEPVSDDRAEMESVNPFMERRLRRAVEMELHERGFAEVEGEAGAGEEEAAVDFYVTAFVVTGSSDRAERRATARRQSQVAFGVTFGHPYRFGYSYPWRFRGYRYPYWGNPYYWSYWGYPSYWGIWGLPYGFWYPSFSVSWVSAPGYRSLGGFPPGTLVVDVFDAKTGELAWRGWAEAALAYAPEADELPAFIDEVVREIMRTFPPEG